MRRAFALVRYFADRFGDTDIPQSGPAFKIIPLEKSGSRDVLATYRDYIGTGGTPISAWESQINAER